MSDKKRISLSETLSALSTEERVWAISFLAQLPAGQKPTKRAKVVNRYHNTMTDEQWEEYFEGKSVAEFPEETPPLDNEFLHTTAGKTIEPLRKWL